MHVRISMLKDHHSKTLRSREATTGVTLLLILLSLMSLFAGMVMVLHRDEVDWLSWSAATYAAILAGLITTGAVGLLLAPRLPVRS